MARPQQVSVTWWTRLGRPPHMLTTPEHRRVTRRWSVLWILLISGLGCAAWPHWTVIFATMLVALQVTQLIIIAAQAAWARRYCDEIRGQYTGHFTRHSAIRREFEVNTGSVSGFYSNFDGGIH